MNGTQDSLVITKEYEGADETAKEYIELMKDTQSLEGMGILEIELPFLSTWK